MFTINIISSLYQFTFSMLLRANNYSSIFGIFASKVSMKIEWSKNRFKSQRESANLQKMTWGSFRVILPSPEAKRHACDFTLAYVEYGNPSCATSQQGLKHLLTPQPTIAIRFLLHLTPGGWGKHRVFGSVSWIKLFETEFRKLIRETAMTNVPSTPKSSHTEGSQRRHFWPRKHW